MVPLALALAVGLSLYAADSGWIPVTGLVVDPANQSIRPIQGLPGASTLGPALNLPFAVNRAAVLGRNAASSRSGCSDLMRTAPGRLGLSRGCCGAISLRIP